MSTKVSGDCDLFWLLSGQDVEDNVSLVILDWSVAKYYCFRLLLHCGNQDQPAIFGHPNALCFQSPQADSKTVFYKQTKQFLLFSEVFHFILRQDLVMHLVA